MVKGLYGRSITIEGEVIQKKLKRTKGLNKAQ
jgi:hypothetical protein